MLDRFSQTASRPALVHCTAGKDRTGLGVAILLWVLGVPTHTIFHDYLLTNDYNDQRNEQMLGMLRQHIASTNGVLVESIDMSPMRHLVTAHRHYLQAALDTILDDFGSIEGYIRRGLGIGAAEQARLKDALLIAPPDQADLS
jgi:protein-tyrosine phosphatase